MSRNVSNFEPSIWGDFFLTYSSPLASSTQQRKMIEQAERLKERVSKNISASSNCNLYQRMQLIDVLERLCLDHLFKEEINVILTDINNADVSGCDLQTVALWFFLFRKHGYRVSPDVFANFIDEQGSFAANSPMDLLNLYNAASLRANGEMILDEAVSFTKRHLESILTSIEGQFAHEVKCALEIPTPRRVRIYEAKHNISGHGEGYEVIMDLAKLNSDLMQLQHQQELRIITRWWKDIELQSRLSFARDRIVECYFWVVGVYYEPSYARSRIILTKVLAIVSILDDTYDVYGTSQECELFTKCVERWDPSVADSLPETMKFIFGEILYTCQSIEDELSPSEKYRMPYLKTLIIDLVRAYNKEVNWREEGYIPATIEEHLHVSSRSGACHLLSCTSFIGMRDIATEEAFDWVSSVPKLVKMLCIILRLSDDLKSYERERMNSHVASTIESCMKEHGVTVEVARERIQDMIEETWKDFNQEWLDINSRRLVPKELLERIFNLTRTMVFMYNQDDAYTNSHVIKDTINSLFVGAYFNDLANFANAETCSRISVCKTCLDWPCCENPSPE
ncbi:hypothetical protein HU200_018151 [Digitaria exilis]|uniref:Sesquiterpene synthase n=1 Tax=Digitaria exilis TaxID=1010633 RepID=A0A835F5G1_9POAL|nr:hypothetical protein HU200_018151 [Digitaria exilis]